MSTRRTIAVTRRRAIRGFTLIELLVTVGIAALLMMVASPSLQELVANNRLRSHNSALQTSLMLARSEAINRKTRVVVCKSPDQATCTTAGGWQQGWIVFVDTNDSASVDAGEAILQRVEALSGSFLLQAGGNLGDYVSYTSTGSAKIKASDNLQTGAFNLCRTGTGTSNARQIEVFATGRLSFGKEPVSTCT